MGGARLLICETGKEFFVKDSSKDLHTQFGYIRAADITKAKDGEVLASNTGKNFFVITPGFFDFYRRIKRGPQIIPRKDIGLILAETGIGKDSVVVDAGSGSGGMALMLANFVKEVNTFDVRDDHIEVVKGNADALGFKNITVKKHDVYESVPIKDADLVILDLPEPWLALENAVKALKHGGFIVSYSPSVPQVMDFVDAVRKLDNLSYIKTSELMERQWEIEARKVRPKTKMVIGHSGFLTFVRKL